MAFAGYTLHKTYPERGAVRQPNREIGKDCQQAIAHWGPEGQVMRNFMDGEEEVLVGGCSDQVCGCKEPPGQHRGVP